MLNLHQTRKILLPWCVRSWARSLLVSLLLAFLLGGRVAQAQSDLSLVIDYSAPARCATEQEFRAGVLAKLRNRLPAEERVSFTVAIDEQGQGTVTFVNADGEQVERALRGDSCEETSAALALIVALAVDAWVESKEAAQGASGTEVSDGSVASEATAQPPVDGVTTTDDLSAAPPQEPTATGSSPPVIARSPVFTSTPSVRRGGGLGAFFFAPGRGIDFGLAAAVATAPAPRLGWEPSAFVGLRDNQQLWALRFSANFFRTSVVRPLTFAGGDVSVRATFQRITAQMDVCPQLIDTQSVQLLPCGFVELGQLRVSTDSADTATGTVAAGSRGAPWISAGVLLRAHTRLYRQWYFEVQGGLELPLRRQPFAVSDTTATPDSNSSDAATSLVYTVRDVGFDLGIGIGVFVQ